MKNMFFGKKQKSRRQRQNLKNLSKKSVDVGKFVKDFYLEKGLAYISCNVAGFNDIIDRYSVKGYEWLEESFARFVEENAIYIPPEYPIILEICGHRFTKEQQDCIEACILDYYALKMGDVQMSIESNRRRILFLAVLMLLFAGIIYVVSLFPDIPRPLSEAPFVLFWMALWDAAELFFLDGKDLADQKLEAAQLASMKVTFYEKFEDGPAEPEVVQEFLEEIENEEIILPSTQWEQEE
ncbi:MAG: hypothetical protein IKN20_01005 [Firmicutes bacterium]|nr:hypothetical protein [Bacillota bacterium]